MQTVIVPEDAAAGATTPAEPRRPMEVYQAGGIIVLSNRPASPEDITTERAASRVSTPPAFEPVAVEPSPSASATTAGTSRASDESDARSAGLWGGLALVALILVAAALVAWERRRRAAAHYAALLADSEPRPSTRAGSAIATETPPPPAPAPDAGEPRSVAPLRASTHRRSASGSGSRNLRLEAPKILRCEHRIGPVGLFAGAPPRER